MKPVLKKSSISSINNLFYTIIAIISLSIIFISFAKADVVCEFYLDEGTGTAVEDSSSNELTGTLAGGATWDNDLFGGSAVSFDGIDDHINIGNPLALNMTGSRTFSAWVKPNSFGSYQVVMAKYIWNYGLWIQCGQLKGYISGAQSLSNETLTTGMWQHVAMTFDIDGDKKIHLYINGKETTYYTQTALSASQSGTSSSIFSIGSDYGNRYWFDGMIGNVIVLDNSMTAAEMLEDYVEQLTLAHWTLDEGTGTAIEDSSLYDFDGTLVGGATWDNDLFGGSAVSFDGTDDHINLGNPSALNMTGSRTFSAWVKPNSFGSYQVVMAKYIWNYGLWIQYGQLKGSISGAKSLSNETLTTGIWQHVAMTFDIDGDKKIHLYINGKETTYNTQTALSASQSGTSSSIFSIGSDYGYRYWFDGMIDNVIVKCKSLTGKEVLEDYTEQCTLAHWQLNEGEGTAIEDSSLYSSNGTLAGGATWVDGWAGDSAVSFDGTGDHIDMGNPLVLNMTGSRTFSAWVKPDSFGSYQVVMAKYIWNYGLWIQYGQLKGYISGAKSLSNETLTTGMWQHVAMTFDIDGDKKIHLYINGKETTYHTQTALSASQSGTSSSIFSIGSDYGYRYWFDGMICKAKVSGIALSGSMIYKDYIADKAIPTVLTEFAYTPDDQETHPIFGSLITETESSLRAKSDVVAVMALSDAALKALLPVKSGISFVGCPVPGCGSPFGSSFTWDISNPNKLTCNYCNTEFPNTTYPEETTPVEVTAPSGSTIEYYYYEDTSLDKERFFFKAGIECHKRTYFEQVAYDLAKIYYLTSETDKEYYAHKASIILCHFAQKFPDFVYKYDYPNRPIAWYDGIPAPGYLRSGFRTSRWSSWAYMDIPYQLILAYDYIYNSHSLSSYANSEGISLYDDIEDNFFHAAAEGALANREHYTNMGPIYWRSLLIAGRVTGAPDYTHIVISRVKTFISDYFYCDGFWKEPTVSYHLQSSCGILAYINPYVSGYSDATGYCPLYGNDNYSDFDPDTEFDTSKMATVADLLIYPFSGNKKYYARIGDTWSSQSRTLTTSGENDSFLLTGLGHAALNGEQVGNGEQVQLHYNFTSRTGHHHSDTLGISLFAQDREMISDIGYTHTKYRPWTSTTASHNLVVVDYKTQHSIFDSKGDIEYMDIDDPNVQIVSVDGRGSYESLGLSMYKRTSFLIKKGSSYYIADFFDIQGGGSTFDYFIHGNSDVDTVGAVTETITLYDESGNPMTQTVEDIISPSLLGTWTEPVNETDPRCDYQYYSYGFFSDTKEVIPNTDDNFARATFLLSGKAFNLFIPTKDESDLSIFTGKNPSVRLASEDNDLVDDYLRTFLCLRKESSSASFATVIEPSGSGIVSGIEKIASRVLKATFSSSTDYIFVDQASQLTISINGKDLIIQGDYGYVSVTSTGVDEYHIVNGYLKYDNNVIVNNAVTLTANVSSTNPSNDKELNFSMTQGSLPPSGLASFIRVTNGGSQLSLGYFINNIDISNSSLETENSLGFDFNPMFNQMMFISYPKLELLGKNEITFFNVQFNN